MNLKKDEIRKEKINKMTRVEQTIKSMKSTINLPSEDMRTVLRGEIALSLAVIADIMIENQEKETK